MGPMCELSYSILLVSKLLTFFFATLMVSVRLGYTTFHYLSVIKQVPLQLPFKMEFERVECIDEID